MKLWKKVLLASVVASCASGAFAQTKLKWAHIMETSEPFHIWSVWAANELNKRTNGKYSADVYPASQLGKENDLNQGLTLGTVDIIVTGAGFAAKSYAPIGVTYYPYTFRDVDHLLKFFKSDVYKDLNKGYAEKKIMTDIAQEASEKASADLVAREKQMVDFFKKKGLSVTDTDRNDFRESVLKSVKFEDIGYRKADWDLIQNIK